MKQKKVLFGDSMRWMHFLLFSDERPPPSINNSQAVVAAAQKACEMKARDRFQSIRQLYETQNAMELESAFSNSCESCIVPNISKNIGAENRLYNVIILMIYLYSTRMHSSRMRTARLLTVSYSAGGGGICPTPTPGYRTPMDADPPLVM